MLTSSSREASRRTLSTTAARAGARAGSTCRWGAEPRAVRPTRHDQIRIGGDPRQIRHVSELAFGFVDVGAVAGGAFGLEETENAPRRFIFSQGASGSDRQRAHERQQASVTSNHDDRVSVAWRPAGGRARRARIGRSAFHPRADATRFAGKHEPRRKLAGEPRTARYTRTDARGSPPCPETAASPIRS